MSASTETGDAGLAQTIAALKLAMSGADTLAANGGEVGDSQLQRMSVRIGPVELLLPADGAREVLAPPAISRIPNTVSWLVGLANVRGNLVPVVDIAAAFRVNRAANATPYLLISGQGDAAMGLVIDGLPRLVSLGARERMSDAPEAPTLLQEAVIAAYTRDRHVWFDVDLGVLFNTLARHIAL